MIWTLTNRNNTAGVKYGIILDGEILRAPINLKRYPAAVPAFAVYVFEQVIGDSESPTRHTRSVVVAAVHIETRRRVTHDVICEGHVLNHRPGGFPILVANGEEDREPVLRHCPIILEDVAVNQSALRVLQLKEVLDPPGPPSVARIPDPPHEWLEAMVATELDVRRNEVRDRRISAAEHEILPCAFEIVVYDLEWAGAIPAADGLGIGALLVAVGDVRVNDRGRGAVERYAAPKGGRRAAMDIDPVKYQVVRQLGQRGFFVAERDYTKDLRDAGCK